jgi:hypothetical protein
MRPEAAELGVLKPWLAKWDTSARARLRRNDAWVTFRRLGHEGWWRALHRWRLWAQILDTPPIITEEAGRQTPVELHLLCCQRDYLTAIWTLKSFYHFSGVRYPLVIHLQGAAPERMQSRLRSHFPAARLVTQPEADAEVEKWLSERGLTRLLAARRQSPFMLKLTDFPILSQAARLLSLDSDVLFFACPVELLQAAPQTLKASRFQRDISDVYNLPVSRARAELGVELAPQVNTGIALFPREYLDLPLCEKYLAHPEVAQPNGWIEQTLHALCASAHNAVTYLPDSYAISLAESADYSPFVARHYAGPSRPLLTREGIPNLLRLGFLDQLRAPASSTPRR